MTVTNFGSFLTQSKAEKQAKEEAFGLQNSLLSEEEHTDIFQQTGLDLDDRNKTRGFCSRSTVYLTITQARTKNQKNTDHEATRATT